jgi:hypothetical protein
VDHGGGPSRTGYASQAQSPSPAAPRARSATEARTFFDGNDGVGDTRAMVFFVATVIGLLLADDVFRLANRKLR